ncbi:branched-chain amino acid ABC transporter permease [Bradyrhizobium tropiciagri]|uniref:branched-chain amino acid ABC transporter permease n=1 Tax=Bradyrhizobium tropiciagri TaxID=312253 RepID=UPI001BA7CD6B|nr:branched-chain amino acid ABC transporter permease [Bradyrhizobium tropiciagri]MBR0896746.1 branched-chain amino acid ABC transporter permease [Bradyrhizobium tropiciagri]
MQESIYFVTRRTTPAIVGGVAASFLVVLLGMAPLLLSASMLDRLTTLFVYIMLATGWNALAGFAGLVSIGQQLFFGLSAYATIRLSDAGMPVFLAMLASIAVVGAFAVPVSWLMLRLREGEFAIGMWILAELAHFIVNLDGVVQGETGTSLIALATFSAEVRQALIYWTGLASVLTLLGIFLFLIRGKIGLAIQAIRDNEEAAQSLGVETLNAKRTVFLFAAVCAATAGVLWLATAITFQPKTFFGVQWTAYMIFMVLVGGIATFEGTILGALIFFLVELVFGPFGVWYLIGLGASAILFSLVFPRGVWGSVESRLGLDLAAVRYRIRMSKEGGRNGKPS